MEGTKKECDPSVNKRMSTTIHEKLDPLFFL